MPVSHLDNSVAEILAFGLNEATGESYSHLTTSEDQMLALLVSEMTGQEYSHLTTGRETLWELLLTQAAADGITFDRNTQSNEQIAAIIANNVSAGGGEEYEGPLDIVGGATVAYGMRALSAAWLGENIFRLQRDSDDAELDFAADATTGDAPVADITTWLDGANGFVTALYDQSGNGITLSESGVPYAFALSSQGGRPALVGRNAAARFSAATVDFATLSFSQLWLAKGEKENGFHTAFSSIVGLAGGSLAYTYIDSSGYAYVDYSGQIDDGYHLIDAVFDTTTSSMFADGVELTGTPDLSGDVVAPINDCVVRTSLNTASQEIQEWVVWNSALSAPDRLAIRQNTATYYGITLS